MAEMGLRRKVLEDRFANHTSSWFAALVAKVRAASPLDPIILVRIEMEDGRPAPEPGNSDEHVELAESLNIRILRCLGEGDYIVALRDDNKVTELYAKGHLDYEVDGLRLIAL
jgi:hypothetical protein